MYEEVKNSVLEHPAYRQFIETDVPYKTYAQKISPQQIAVLRRAFPEGFSVNVGGAQAKIDVDALASADAFKKAIQQVSPEGMASNPLAVIDQIATQQGHTNAPQQMVAQNPGPVRV